MQQLLSQLFLSMWNHTRFSTVWLIRVFFFMFMMLLLSEMSFPSNTCSSRDSLQLISLLGSLFWAAGWIDQYIFCILKKNYRIFYNNFQIISFSGSFFTSVSELRTEPGTNEYCILYTSHKTWYWMFA